MKYKTIFSVFFVSLCFAQSNNYVAQQWNIEDGLPQSTVRCITQTHDGYVWAGTWNGLARFDGVRMKIFNVGNTPALHVANIMSLYCDGKGCLWIGTDAGGLVRYEKNTFVRCDTADGFEATRILSLNEDQAGRMWFATEIGIYVFDGNRFHHFTEAHGLIHTYANQVCPYPLGKMYVGFVNSGSIVHFEKDSLITEHSFSVGGYAIAIDSLGALWYGVRGKGFVRKHNGKDFVDERFADLHPKETYLLRNDEKWLLTPNDIRIINNSTQKILQAVDGVSLSEITTVFEDRERNIWLGKEGGGLILLRKKQIDVLSRQNGFQANEIMSGIQDRDRKVWIGTWDNGLLGSENSTARKFASSSLPKQVSSIYSLSESPNGTLWVGTWGNGLFSIRHNRVEHFIKGGINEFSSIVSAIEDTKSRLWIGTAHDGVVCFSGSEQHAWNTGNGLSSDRVNSILCAKNGDTWISVSANGVNRISGVKLTVYKMGSGLNDNAASPMYEDDEGSIWIGTNRGLNRWKNGSFAYVTEEQGLFDNAIGQIIQDDGGNFWIGAIHGISRIEKQELNDAADGKIRAIRCLTIGKEDGMLNEETGGGGTNRCWKTSDGRLWFSTSKGVVVIDPKRFGGNSLPPGVMIDEVLVDDHAEEINSEIMLQPGKTKLELGYTGIHFAAPKKIRFHYLLDGFDKGWNDAGTKRIAHYMNLNPGRYVFRVKAQSNAGVWSAQEATVGIVVLPEYYQTLWFRATVLFLFLTVGPLLYAVRVRQLKREKEKQIDYSRRLIESQETERKRIATELHDGLGQNLLIIKNKLLVALQSLGKEIPTTNQIEEASDIVTSTIEEVRSISHNLRPHQLDQLGITKTLRSVVRQANESTTIEFISNIQDIDGAMSSEEEINLFRIVQEAFNNIIKHSNATKVDMGVVRDNNTISVSIRDNGKGVLSSTGFGISGMKERAKMFGWNIQFDSESGRGTHILLIISNAKP